MKRFAKLVAVCAGAPLLALGVAVPAAWADNTQSNTNGAQHNSQGNVSTVAPGGLVGSVLGGQGGFAQQFPGAVARSNPSIGTQCCGVLGAANNGNNGGQSVTPPPVP
jgi:hypothetical protein